MTNMNAEAVEFEIKRLQDCCASYRDEIGQKQKRIQCLETLIRRILDNFQDDIYAKPIDQLRFITDIAVTMLRSALPETTTVCDHPESARMPSNFGGKQCAKCSERIVSTKDGSRE